MYRRGTFWRTVGVFTPVVVVVSMERPPIFTSGTACQIQMGIL